jgi:hypothetical protein
VNVGLETKSLKSQQEPQTIQELLDKKNIPLNCANPPRQNSLNDLYHENIKKYLEYLSKSPLDNNQHIKSFWEDSKKIDKVTIEELEKCLFACTQHLDKQLEGDYDVGFVPKKSSKWIAELALPYLSKIPLNHFEYSTDVGGQQTTLSARSQQFVIFDDASYSGSQLVTVISSLQTQLTKQGKKGKLFLVVPFISAVAEKHLIKNLTEKLNAPYGTSARENSRKLQIHLITSNRELKTTSGAYPDSQEGVGFSFTQWKVPDTASIPSGWREGTIIEGGQAIILPLLTDYPPCYKN